MGHAWTGPLKVSNPINASAAGLSLAGFDLSFDGIWLVENSRPCLSLVRPLPIREEVSQCHNVLLVSLHFNSRPGTQPLHALPPPPLNNLSASTY